MPVVRAAARFASLTVLVALAGCSGPSPGGAPAGASSNGTPATCKSTCEESYDSCTSRFSGLGGSGPGIGGINAPSQALGPNDVCPDQLKSCLRGCLQ